MKNKRQYVLASLILILATGLFLGGCVLKKNQENSNNAGNNQIANPASVFCEEQGGESEIINEEEGQRGICNLPNEIQCDEWEFFRGECPSIDLGQAGQKILTGNNQIKVIGISANDSVSSPFKLEGETNVGEGKLIIELRNNNHDTLVKEIANIKKGEDEKGVFSINLHYVFTGTKEGYIAIYQAGENGEELNLVEIPVKFGK